MHKIKIAFDLDGVLVDMIHVFNICLQETYKISVPETYDQFDISKTLPLTKKQIWEIFYKAYPKVYLFPIYPGAKKLLAKLHEATGEPITILTARPYQFAPDTYQLAQRICKKIPFTLILKHKRCHKSCHLAGFEYYIEDRRKTALELVGMGFKMFLVDKCYNQIPFQVANLAQIDLIADLIPRVDDLVVSNRIFNAA